MMKNDLILRHPLRSLGYENEDILSKGGLGAVLARAGVGKTALLVQVALNTMLRGKKVLHVSMNDPVGKVALWYDELFQHLAEQHQIERTKTLWEDILPNRFIMTFKVEGFSVPRLEERLNDLTEQGIFKPDIIIIDGFQFDDKSRDALIKMKIIAEKYAVREWFTVPIHRHEEEGREGMPVPLLRVEDLFEVVLLLATENGETRIRALKGSAVTGDSPVFVLDPSSMLIRDAS
ncbi:MAG: AAA family ATPase [Syntrophales bacterium]|nr:AAA family ATPase [Syntrophales bacterium]